MYITNLDKKLQLDQFATNLLYMILSKKAAIGI